MVGRRLHRGCLIEAVPGCLLVLVQQHLLGLGPIHQLGLLRLPIDQPRRDLAAAVHPVLLVLLGARVVVKAPLECRKCGRGAVPWARAGTDACQGAGRTWRWGTDSSASCTLPRSSLNSCSWSCRVSDITESVYSFSRRMCWITWIDRTGKRGAWEGSVPRKAMAPAAPHVGVFAVVVPEPVVVVDPADGGKLLLEHVGPPGGARRIQDLHPEWLDVPVARGAVGKHVQQAPLLRVPDTRCRPVAEDARVTCGGRLTRRRRPNCAPCDHRHVPLLISFRARRCSSFDMIRSFPLTRAEKRIRPRVLRGDPSSLGWIHSHWHQVTSHRLRTCSSRG